MMMATSDLDHESDHELGKVPSEKTEDKDINTRIADKLKECLDV